MELADLRTSKDDILGIYGKTQESLQSDVNILKEWMKKQPHLPADLLQDEFLEIHLLKNKFAVEKAKSKIESYCTMKGLPRFEYLYGNEIYIPSEEPAFYVTIPNLTDDFRRIYIGKLRDQKKWEMKRDFANGLMLREIWSRFDYNDGEIFLYDWSISSPMVMSKFRVNILSDFLDIILKAHSARVSEIHIICKFAFTIFSWAKPFLPAKIASRVRVHDSIENIATFIPKKCLPKDYGGELKSLDEITNDWDRIFADHRQDLLGYLGTKAREELRLGGSDPDIMQGTFKKLEID